ncbi:MAG: hypothetical protein ACYCXP_01655 [Leptospirillum sp.]
MIASRTRSGKTALPKQPAGRWTRLLSVFSEMKIFVSFVLLVLLSGCGGGPDVSQSTGHGILLATPQGLFNISFSTNGANTLTSTTPIIAGSITAMVTVENASYPVNGPMLVTTNGTTLTAYSMSGGVPAATGDPISPSCTLPTLSSIASLSVTPDGKYLLVTTSGSNTLSIIHLANGYSCTQTSINSGYPTSVSVECLQIGSSCQIFLTLSSSASNNTPVPPGVVPWTEGTLLPSSSTPTSLTGLKPASSAIFDNETSYFYALITASNNSSVYNVSGVTTLSSSSTYNTSVSYSNVPFSNPCLDPLGQTLYTPTYNNGSVYSASVSTSGSIGTPQQIWSLTSNPSGAHISPITACAAY